jgi:crotonobetainyl-CoA:carnitine CoA-transferase CaiB-like acyl-CoA transferase
VTPGGPLAGVRILEVGTMLAGPYATMLLADLGAEVTKIEPPGGEISRGVGPSYFASLNRNKSSECLDLNSDGGQQRLGELVAESHALLVNLKPSSIRRLGLTYEALRRHNERIVCVAITGFGLHGGDDPAFDYVVQASTGIAALTGDPECARRWGCWPRSSPARAGRWMCRCARSCCHNSTTTPRHT